MKNALLKRICKNYEMVLKEEVGMIVDRIPRIHDSRGRIFLLHYMIETYGLTKVLQGKEVVSDVSLHVKKNEIYGFLGPNGAGKTTIMRMIGNLVKPTSGEIQVFGQVLTNSSYEVFKRMSSIIEYPAFYDKLTGKQNLALHREYMGYYSPNCIEDALSMLDLTAAADKQVKTYSLGMKQRLALARAVMTKPELLILDEPTNGLDPVRIKQFRDLLKELVREQGMTIMITSHNLNEIENLADTVGLIHRGRLVKEITMDEIQNETLSYIELGVNDVKRASFVLTEQLGAKNFKIIDETTIRVYDTRLSTRQLSKELIQNDLELDLLSKKSDSLEDYFLRMTKGG